MTLRRLRVLQMDVDDVAETSGSMGDAADSRPEWLQLLLLRDDCPHAGCTCPKWRPQPSAESQQRSRTTVARTVALAHMCTVVQRRTASSSTLR